MTVALSTQQRSPERKGFWEHPEAESLLQQLIRTPAMAPTGIAMEVMLSAQLYAALQDFLSAHEDWSLDRFVSSAVDMQLAHLQRSHTTELAVVQAAAHRRGIVNLMGKARTRYPKGRVKLVPSLEENTAGIAVKVARTLSEDFFLTVGWVFIDGTVLNLLEPQTGLMTDVIPY